MKTAIILHGMPSKESYLDVKRKSQSNSHWLPWIQQRLIVSGILAQTPELPEPYRPDYAAWKELFERFPIDEETTLVGHSCGGGFLVRWLSENKAKVGKVALVAPWIDPKSDRTTPGFFDFSMDPEFASRTKGTMVFVSKDDSEEEVAVAGRLAHEVKDIQLTEFTDRGHFTMEDMKTEEFPELAKFLLS